MNCWKIYKSNNNISHLVSISVIIRLTNTLLLYVIINETHIKTTKLALQAILML